MSQEKAKPIKGYKAFNKDMTCQGFQFKEGKTYKTDEVEVCKKGFHFCKNPLDVLNYYNITDSVFCEVVSTGETDREQDGKDSKVATTEITIVRRLSLQEFINAAVEYGSQNASSGYGSKNASSGDGSKNASSGDRSQNASSGYGSKNASSGDESQNASSGDESKNASSGDESKNASSGDESQNASSGDRSQNASSGDRSQIEMTGEHSVGVSAGADCKIKGIVGCWITLAEWDYVSRLGHSVPVCVKSAKIDGKKLKADTWYELKNGAFVEAE